MTQYNTRTLAESIIGEDEVGTNAKAATRTLRKFLRDETSGVDGVGKGGRYTIELKAAELKAMKKRFAAWEAKQEADKAARAELREAQAPKKTEAIILPTDDEGTEDINDEVEDDEVIAEGPTDDEIAAMLEDDDLIEL